MKQTQPLSYNDLERLLTFVSADTARDEWVKVLMAIKSEFGDEARDIAQHWSETAGNYKATDFLSTWKSIKARGGVTIGSLVKLAMDAGFKFAPMSEADIKQLKQERRERKQALEVQREQEEYQTELAHIAIAEDSRQRYENANKAPANHPYLVNKGIQPHGIKSGSFVGYGEWLMIPVYGSERPFINDIQSIQYISPNGEKRFAKGGKKSGGFYPIRWTGDNRIVICEGFATGATLAEYYATCSSVICAFDAGNLGKVTEWVLKTFEGAYVVIAGDNDHKGEISKGINVGKDTAEAVAKRYGIQTMIPHFEADETGSDWNDRYLLDQNKMRGAA